MGLMKVLRVSDEYIYIVLRKLTEIQCCVTVKMGKHYTKIPKQHFLCFFFANLKIFFSFNDFRGSHYIYILGLLFFLKKIDFHSAYSTLPPLTLPKET